LKKRRILVTGSNGLLGQKLIELLAQHPDFETIATSKGANRLPITNGYQYMEMDITDRLQVEKVFAETLPEIVIHTAAMTNVDQCELEKEACWLLNVTAVENLIHACSKYQVFLQHRLYF
jgi:dTDP-4-dehydrorhamnose reductase